MAPGTKRKINDDGDFVPSEEAASKQTKKTKLSAVDTPKPIPKPVRKWTQEENEKLKLGILWRENVILKLISWSRFSKL